jgi:hypothetical protein
MQRILTVLSAAVMAATVMAAGPSLARDRDNDGKQRRSDRPHRAQRDDARAKRPVGIPPLFRELCPHKARRIDRQIRHEPGKARRVVVRLHRMAREMEGIKKRDPEEFERRCNTMRTEDEVARLSEELKKAKTDKDRARAEKKLRAKLSGLFDQKEEALRARIGRMEQDIREAKAKLDRRREKRERIIERRLEDLKEGDDLRF